MSTNKETHIHWFGNDLRLTDQPFIHLLDNKKYHFGIYVIDPRKYEHLPLGFRKTGLKRLRFLREHLNDLQHQYEALGSSLVVLKGFPEKIIPHLVRHYDASISFQLEYATEERNVQKLIMEQINLRDSFTYDGNFLVHPSVCPFESFPNSFSGFRKKAEKAVTNSISYALNQPKNLPGSPKDFGKLNVRRYLRHEKSVFPFQGGETAALQRLNHYLFETNAVHLYKEKRNGLLGIDYSSKLSPWLASGALSPRMALSELKKYEKTYGSNAGTNWLVFELLWRDYFRHAGKHYLNKIFHSTGISGAQKKYSENLASYEDWRQAKTGNQFIDANLKELVFTGYMSNRGRQNAASYLVHNLNQNWQLGAAWFEHHLLDYDVYTNQGNWLYIAGHGFNPKGASIFDISFQANHYDPYGTYRNYWMNEKLS
jgi:deoxyribodipyrimidine photo-lyase